MVGSQEGLVLRASRRSPDRKKGLQSTQPTPHKQRKVRDGSRENGFWFSGEVDWIALWETWRVSRLAWTCGEGFVVLWPVHTRKHAKQRFWMCFYFFRVRNGFKRDGQCKINCVAACCVSISWSLRRPFLLSVTVELLALSSSRLLLSVGPCPSPNALPFHKHNISTMHQLIVRCTNVSRCRWRHGMSWDLAWLLPHLHTHGAWCCSTSCGFLTRGEGWLDDGWRWCFSIDCICARSGQVDRIVRIMFFNSCSLTFGQSSSWIFWGRPSDAEPEVGHAHGRIYDCNAGFSNWMQGWSDSKKEPMSSAFVCATNTELRQKGMNRLFLWSLHFH